MTPKKTIYLNLTSQCNLKCEGGCREMAYEFYGDHNAPDPFCPVLHKGEEYSYLDARFL